MQSLNKPSTPYPNQVNGFDLLNSIFQNVTKEKINPSFTQYNILQVSDSDFEIELSVPGFLRNDISIKAEETILNITGNKRGEGEESDTKDNESVNSKYVHRGFSVMKSFSKAFQLPDRVKVTGAALDNGILTVKLEKEMPKETNSTTIEIK